MPAYYKIILDSEAKKMRLIIDDIEKKVTIESNGNEKELDFYSPEAFASLSDLWLKMGWGLKYTYTFTWMGRPVIQLPEDMLRTQELIFSLRPDVIVETGVAHGGSLVFYASLCSLMGKGRVVGVDIEIRPHNRKAIEEHPLASWITLIEGNAVAPEIFEQVCSECSSAEVVLVLLDSCHEKDHVLKELELYSQLVSVGSYIVATDGIMQNLQGTPRSKNDWNWNNPAEAAREFVKNNPRFAIEPPRWSFNESPLSENITHWPDAWIKKIKAEI